MAGLILDASALLTLLMGEAGGRKVASRIDGAAVTTVGWSEVVAHYARGGAERTAIETMLRPLPVRLVPVDTDLAVRAGLLRAATADAGLSAGDRLCLALGAREKMPVWTADPSWKAVGEAADVKVVIIR